MILTMSVVENSYSPLLVVINVGSSTIKMAVYQVEKQKLYLNEKCQTERDVSLFIERFKLLVSGRKGKVMSVAHRFVALAPNIQSPAVLTEKLLARLVETEDLAPLHNPLAISIIKICQSIFAHHVLQTIHSDSEFFNILPSVASDYAISRAITAHGNVKKTGFHGLAHRSMLHALREAELKRNKNNQRVITIQLGSGCSICAIKGDSPMDISMGSSTNEGLIMANRSGDVDAVSLLRIQIESSLDAEQIINELNQTSGILGLTGYSGDMEKIIRSDSDVDKEAIEKYCYRIRKYIGAYAAILGGLDCLVIGGGVGANSSLIRKKILSHWEWLSMLYNEKSKISLNDQLTEISHAKSKVKIFICKIDEELLIAGDAFKIISRIYS